MKILVTVPKGEVFNTFFDNEICLSLSKLGNVEYNTNLNRFTEDELCEKIKDVDILFTGWGDNISDKVIDNANKLSIIAHTGGSVGGLVTDKVYDNGIIVLSGNEIYAFSVAEGVICYILSSLRKIPFYVNQMKNDGWKENNWYNEGLIGKKVGLVGFGSITKKLVPMLKLFNTDIFIASNHLSEDQIKEYGIKKASINEIFSSCDIISIHLAQNEKNYHIISKEQFDLIREGALFVNTSRGSIIDENALYESMKDKKFYSILDVYEQEPLPIDSPLRTLDNIIMIPHMAGPTIDKRKYVTNELIKEIEKVLNGEESYLNITRETMHHMTK